MTDDPTGNEDHPLTLDLVRDINFSLPGGVTVRGEGEVTWHDEWRHFLIMRWPRVYRGGARHAVYIAFGCILLLLVTIFFIVTGDILGGFICGVLITLAWSHLQWGVFYLKHKLKLAVSPGKPIMVEAGPEGVAVRHARVLRWASWSEIGVFRFDAHVSVLGVDESSFLIPSSVFATEEDCRTFRSLAIKALGQCSKCEYPLRGITRETCPECGHPIDDAISIVEAQQKKRNRSFRLS